MRYPVARNRFKKRAHDLSGRRTFKQADTLRRAVYPPLTLLLLTLLFVIVDSLEDL